VDNAVDNSRREAREIELVEIWTAKRPRVELVEAYPRACSTIATMKTIGSATNPAI